MLKHFIFLLIPIVSFGSDFKIVRTSGNILVTDRIEQKIELGQKYYILSDSIVTGQAYIIKITDKYCVFELSEGKAYAGDKLVELNKLDQAKYEIAKKQLKQDKFERKLQFTVFAWLLITAIIATVIYLEIK